MFNGQKKHEDEPIKQAQVLLNEFDGENFNSTIKFALKAHFEHEGL